MGRQIPVAARLALLGLGAVGSVAAGAAVGVFTERRLVGRRFDLLSSPYGTLSGEEAGVIADDNVYIHAEVDEPAQPSDVTVIFCHGYALNLHSWHFQRLALRPHARLVFWDQRSHGRSQRSGAAPTIDELGEDLRCVMDNLAPTGHIVLVGHSMGGMTIMALAARYPELFGTRVTGVALLATTAGGISDISFGLPTPIGKLLHRWAPTFAGALAKRPALVESGRRSGSDLGLILTQLFSFGNPRVNPGLTAFVAEMIDSTPVEVIASFLPALERHDKVEALSALERVETLVMVGDSDLLIPESHSHEIVRRLPGAEFVVLQSAGHMLTLERHEEVDAHLLALLERARGA
jgi:pimeloyl-ACP methyl ester carboxylesterase